MSHQRRKINMENKFVALIDPKTVVHSRVDAANVATEEDPIMPPYPELIDIGIISSCANEECSLRLAAHIQSHEDDLRINEPDMLLPDSKRIIGKTYQAA